MKNLKITFALTLFVTALLFTSCQSDSDSENENPVENSTGDYWPTTVGNQWVLNQNGAESTMKIVSSEDLNGHKYYKFNQFAGASNDVSGTASVSIRKDKGDYYIKMDKVTFEQMGIKGEMTGYEFLLLKDYLEVNKTWTGTFSQTTTYNIPEVPVIKTTTNYTGTILEKGISLVVKGVTYKDVIKFKFLQKTTVSGLGETSTSEVNTDYWVSKNVGVIKMTSGGIISELVTYAVK
jgi:hypothetical protein